MTTIRAYQNKDVIKILAPSYNEDPSKFMLASIKPFILYDYYSDESRRNHQLIDMGGERQLHCTAH